MSSLAGVSLYSSEISPWTLLPGFTAPLSGAWSPWRSGRLPQGDGDLGEDGLSRGLHRRLERLLPFLGPCFLPGTRWEGCVETSAEPVQELELRFKSQYVSLQQNPEQSARSEQQSEGWS